MQVEFQDHYIIVIVLVLWVLCCCRGFLEACTVGMHVLDKCVDLSCCDLRDVLGCHDASVCGVLVKRLVILFCFLQPLLLCVVRLVGKEENLEWYTSVRLFVFAPGAVVVHNSPRRERVPVTVDLELVEIDYLLLAMPLAITTSLNCICFAHWSLTLEGSSDWDEGLGGSEDWFLYEVTYYLQILCMNWLLLALACREQTVTHVYFSGMALSLVMWFFMAASRFPHQTTADHWGSSMAFTVLLMTLLPLWETMRSLTCSMSVAACVVHGLAVFVLVMGHYMALGRASVAQICLLRFCTTIAYSVFNMVVLSLGDSVCAAGSGVDAALATHT